FVLFISFGTVIVVSTFIFIGVIIIIIGRPFIIVIVVVSILVFSWCFSVLFVISIIIPVARIFSFLSVDFKCYIDFFFIFLSLYLSHYYSHRQSLYFRHCLCFHPRLFLVFLRSLRHHHYHPRRQDLLLRERRFQMVH